MIPDIVILGGGVSGWMAAAGLAAALGGAGRIRLVETPGEAPARGVAATLPSIRGFHDRLGLDEGGLVREAGGTFTLGVEFAGWSGPGSRFFQPFGAFGASVGSVGFHHAWLRLRSLGEETGIEAWCLAAAAARLGRFQRPSREPASVMASFDYGLNLDAAAYEARLRGCAEARGVQACAGRLRAVRLDGEDGSIAALELDGGESLAAGLFLDCTSDGRLIHQALGVARQDWSGWLPCDRAAWTQIEGDDGLPPFTRVEAVAPGWRWRGSLQDRTVCGLVYCSRLTDDEAAADALLDDGQASAPVRVERFTAGRAQTPWARNCVAIGAAAATLEPLTPAGLHLVHSAVERLAALLPDPVAAPAQVAEYNRLTVEQLDRVRDFLILHQHLNGRTDGPLWMEGRAAAIPEELAWRIEAFRSRARVTTYGAECFTTPAWLAALLGLGVRPRRGHPFADGLDADMLRRHLEAQRRVVADAAASMPAHRAFLAGLQ